jgi:dipeptidyl-peptidase-3
MQPRSCPTLEITTFVHRKDAFALFSYLHHTHILQGSGDQKFVPNVSPDVLNKLVSKSSKLRKLYEEISASMFSTPPFSLGYPGDLAQSAYYPGPSIISKDEIGLVSQALEERCIFPENTRIRKVELGTPIFEVLLASIEKDSQAEEFTLPGSKGLVRIIRGDHSEELAQICSSLTQASKYAANETQRVFLSQYIESFRTGSLHAYRDSQRTWIRDKIPRVENIFGFVEPYRDPYGTRAEFEGLVAISDTEETKALTRLVEHSATFIRRLPWAEGGSAENDRKGPFEKALFEPPDFTSIHGMYCIALRDSSYFAYWIKHWHIALVSYSPVSTFQTYV